MPPDTEKVDRTTLFGNPWRAINEHLWGNGWVVLDPAWVSRPKRHYCLGRVTAVRLAIRLHAEWIRSGFGPDLSLLRGKNLACWCPLDGPCHADVLLEVANA